MLELVGIGFKQNSGVPNDRPLLIIIRGDFKTQLLGEQDSTRPLCQPYGRIIKHTGVTEKSSFDLLDLAIGLVLKIFG